MNITEGPLKGLLVVQNDRYEDERGYFNMIFHELDYQRAGIESEFTQDNVSVSHQGVVRGLHFQDPLWQAKLVTVLEGEVYDVVVDLRVHSPTFKQWCGMVLSDYNRKQLYIPVGFAHGFQVLSPQAIFHYKCSGSYDPEHELALRWDDPELGIEWRPGVRLISAKDRQAPLFQDIPKDRLFF